MIEQKPDEINTPELNKTPEESFDYWDEIGERYEHGCPSCGSDEIVLEPDEGSSYYCEACHTYI